MKEVRFGDLAVGATFYEKPDEFGIGWIAPLVKVEPVGIQGEWFNTRANKLLVGFWEDDDIVLV